MEQYKAAAADLANAIGPLDQCVASDDAALLAGWLGRAESGGIPQDLTSFSPFSQTPSSRPPGVRICGSRRYFVNRASTFAMPWAFM